MRDIPGWLRAAASPAVIMALLLCALLLLAHGKNPDAAVLSLEERAAEMLSGIEGVGEVKVVIRTRSTIRDSESHTFSQEKNEEVPCGVVAVVQGADNPIVRIKLTQALCALLGLHAGQVEVLSMAGGGEM